LRKGDKPSSFPAAHSNGNKYPKVSAQAKPRPRSPDTLDGWLPSPPPLTGRGQCPPVCKSLIQHPRSFWSIYKNSPPGWRNEWRQQTSEWNDFLGAAFDSLLAAAQNGQTSQAALSHKFTFFRETFCDKLSQIDPVSFRRHGAALASVCRILGHILNGFAECEPYLDQVVACDWYGTSMDARCSFSLIGSTQMLDKYLNDDDISPPLP